MENFQPMIALNVYLEPYFRQEILDKVLAQRTKLPEQAQRDLSAIFRSEIQIRGFRNPLAAPHGLLVKESEKKFEKDSRFLRVILSAWVSTLDFDPQELSAALTELGFVPSEVAAEFEDPENALLEGWPAGLSYADLEQKVSEKVPSLKISQNELALLTIWLTGRLPGAAS